MTSAIIIFPMQHQRKEAHHKAPPICLVPPTGERVSLRTTRLADLGSLRIVGKARTLSAQLAELAERACGIVPNWRD